MNLIDRTLERIREFCPTEGCHLAFSDGKDSQALLLLAREAGVRFDAVYNVTTIDPWE